MVNRLQLKKTLTLLACFTSWVIIEGCYLFNGKLMSKVCTTSSVLLGTLLTFTGPLGPAAFADANTKISGSFGSPNTNAAFSYVQIKGLEYAFAVISNDSTLYQRLNLASPSVFRVDCSGGISILGGSGDFKDGKWSTTQIKKYSKRLSNDFCNYLKSEGFISR